MVVLDCKQAVGDDNDDDDGAGVELVLVLVSSGWLVLKL